MGDSTKRIAEGALCVSELRAVERPLGRTFRPPRARPEERIVRWRCAPRGSSPPAGMWPPGGPGNRTRIWSVLLCQEGGRMVEGQITRIEVTCVYCGQLHEPVDWISLNPVCPGCAASRPPPPADESRREPRERRAGLTGKWTPSADPGRGTDSGETGGLPANRPARVLRLVGAGSSDPLRGASRPEASARGGEKPHSWVRPGLG
jgi:hypothetical protein